MKNSRNSQLVKKAWRKMTIKDDIKLEKKIKERPIIFSGELIPPTLEGRKTKTRRTRNLEVINETPYDFEFRGLSERKGILYAIFRNKINGEETLIKCPYGKVRDFLWVRETWCLMRESADYETGNEYYYFDWDESVELAKDCLNLDPRASSCKSIVCYPADGEDENPCEMHDTIGLNGKLLSKKEIPWRSPIHMPRWASRITLEITDIKVERLQDISEKDAIAEGIEYNGGCEVPRKTFEWLWESIKGSGSWAANPWVWVISFKKIN